jgi:hypothetical protein
VIILLSAFAIVGLRNSVDLLLHSFTKGDIEYWLDELESVGANEWIFKVLKPLISCVYCMASVWGSFFYFLFSLDLNNSIDWFMWLPSILVIAGLIKWIEK